MEILVPLAMFAMIVAFVWFGNVTRRREDAHRADLMRQVIEKFSSGDEFARTLQSLEGQRLVEALSFGRRDESNSKVGMFTGGAITTCLGIGFFILSRTGPANFWIPAVIVSSIGVALLVSSYVAWRSEKSILGQLSEAARGPSEDVRRSTKSSDSSLP